MLPHREIKSVCMLLRVDDRAGNRGSGSLSHGEGDLGRSNVDIKTDLLACDSGESVDESAGVGNLSAGGAGADCYDCRDIDECLF